MSLKDPKKIHENDEFAIFKGKDGHELKILKKGLSEKLRKELSSLPVHAYKGEQIMSSTEGESEPNIVDKAVDEFQQSGPKNSARVAGEGARAAQQANNELITDTLKTIAGGEGAWNRASQPKEKARDTSQALSQGPMSIAPETTEPEPQVQSELDAIESTPPAPLERAPAVAPKPKKNPVQTAVEDEQEQNMEAKKIYIDMLNGHIKPKTYQDFYQDKSTLGKIGSIFGLLFAGAGAGLTGGPNVLLEMMNKEIERDIKAQEKSTENAQNLYNLNIQKELARANMTRAQAEAAGIWETTKGTALKNTLTGLQLGATAKLMSDAQLLPPDQRAKALGPLSTVEGAVFNDIATRNKKQAALRAMGHLGVLPGAQNIADDNDARYVPGINGEASIPVDAAARKEIGTHQALEDSVTDLLDYSKKHTNLIPGSPAYNEGRTKLLAVQQMIREGLLGTVFRESEKPLLQAFVGADNPAGAFKMLSTQPKLRSILESNRISSNALKKQYGLPTKKTEDKDSETVIWNGKKYKRGPGGKAVKAD